MQNFFVIILVVCWGCISCEGELQEIIPSVGNIVCPDGNTECANTDTCCFLTSGKYGCCPYSSAVCCSDHIHCCPYGYICQLPNCIPRQKFIHKELTKTHPATSLVQYVLRFYESETICDNTESRCPESNTCCAHPDGDFTCCPYKDASCCSDGLHCCPQGYVCNSQQQKCVQELKETKAVKKIVPNSFKDLFLSLTRKKITKISDLNKKVKNTASEGLANVLCPDKMSECPEGNTCCKLSSGQYGCCPLPKATCCSDGVHCCPNGYTCNGGLCMRGNEQIKAFKHSRSLKKASNVACPDGSQCPEGNTCCKLSTGGFGCCPLPKATCCSDGVHCCPNGYACNGEFCTKGDKVIKALKHTTSLKKGENIVCPDGQSECPEGNTCCKLSGGQYGCCPLPKATCCSDEVHCCPNGYTCNAGSCTKGDEVIKAFKHTASLKKGENIVCPDGQSQCPDGNTCCKLSSGQYGCCPLPKATCCSDGVHCCPDGYTCNAGSCTKGEEVIKAFKHTMSLKKSENVVCPDGQSQCPDGNTCCKLSSGQYGCCPLPKATCCSDGEHCCPNGYSCNGEFCTKGDEVIKAFKHTASLKKGENIVCPDGQSQCPDGNTCCRLSSGQYGCCPLPKATCCSDGVHCCPNGYTCNAGSCTKGEEVIKAFKHTMSLKKSENVVCPDGQSQCPDGNTCCKLSSGQYGCCPLPKATCCSDGEHCCPNGYSCNGEFCTKGDEVIKAFKHTASLKKGENIVCPDGQSQCPDGNTCCRLSSGQYGCCPLPKATCCSDGVHCCPNGYTCNAGSCTKGEEVIKAFKHTMSLKKSENVVCPDGQSQCPDGNTCCKLSSGQYGCCPLPKATCCSDGEHCCPNGYSCNGEFCTKGDEVIKAFKHTASLKKGENIVCPDGQSQCPDGNTCCRLSSGQYGCCPLPKATCCSDGVHCCPNGYTCNAGSCTKGEEVIKAFKHTMSLKKSENVVCPDGQSQCPDGNTCCKLSSGQYGCCPLPKATCCSDGEHCCPNGYSCNGEFCTKGDEVIKAFKHTASLKKGENIVCPDGQSQCPDGNTCCRLSSGQYGCCPLPKATCCSDGVHCCPNGYTCNAGSCTKGEEVIKAFKHTMSLKKSENVVCPDGQSQCPDGNTCCKLSSGQYGCCPLPKATCCSDGEHCCPNGYSCNGEFCTKGDEVIKAFKHTASLKKGENIVCPDGQSQCPDGNTCCRLSSGQYGCCPLPKATCCSDGVHCCPNGYTCNAGSCTKGEEVIKAFKHTMSLKKSENVVCPDGQSQCPDGNTCCKLSSGQYGCCPLPKATCCSDGEHCCPNGYSCNGEFCTKGDEVIKAFKHTASLKKGENIVCPDGQSQCPDGNTCCRLSSGQYGCCPLPKATCCSDGVHCCPNGYTCNAGSCTKGEEVIKAFKHTMSLKKSENVVCPDGQSQCPDGNTCCKLSSGQYGCCPLPKATCCSDGEHCCPNGYSCNGEFCTKGDEVIKAFKHTASLKKGENIVCPDGQSQCPDGNTCCRLSSGQYGCCPLPKATCCSDGVHCCPNGYTCNAGSCTKGEEVIKAFKHTMSLKKSENVVCPDGQSQCPDGNTCCKLSSGQYGCCPLPKATCCSDGEHCCPNGYSCNGEFCTKGDEVIKAFKHTASLKKGENIVCPDGQSQCPDGNTCCRLSSGQYGCCPLPKATCCSDGVHCCPNGYTCDAGSCTKGEEVIKAFKHTMSLKKSENVVCPDGQSQCPDGNTCCKLSSGQYGCCPLPKATCCSDGEHCCPNGYSCNGEFCTKGDEVIKAFKHTASLKKGENIVCPDGQSQCPDGNTCCRLSSGQYGCCPLPKATCCSDGVHCCPNGYTCDAGSCTKGEEVIKAFKHTMSLKKSENVVCPDGQSQCPDGNTCCKLSSGQYGCCPLPKATCCSDGEHCCPNGYSCNGEFCTKGDEVIKAFKHTTSLKKGENIVCPDGQSQCPDGNTCCKLSSGQYGCCALPKATCCSDGVHCCPNGYTCNGGLCTKGDDVIKASKHTIAIRKFKDNICPDGISECPVGNTCCKSSDGSYACCPLPNAVCCSDRVHCCPHGYTCDAAGGTCNLNGHVIKSSKSFLASIRSRKIENPFVVHITSSAGRKEKTVDESEYVTF